MAAGLTMPTQPEHGTAAEPDPAAGILPAPALRRLIDEGALGAAAPIEPEQVQPASLDLRLGDVAWRVRASFLPGERHSVQDKIDAFGMHAMELTTGAVLERGCVYIVPLMERAALPADVEGIANPKSSSGRLDIFTRLITDRASSFDRVTPGYRGPLYAEIAPRTFSILVRKGVRLNQLRLRRGQRRYDDAELAALNRRLGLVDAPEPSIRNGGIALTVDLKGEGGAAPIGWKARRHTALIDVEKVGHYPAAAFWEPIRSADALAEAGGLILNPDDFYILASREAVAIPPDHAAEMVAYDTLVGEFRVHYAGFFDPGFGWGEAARGTRAVLEVRSHEVPFLLEHGQTIGRLVYEPLAGASDRLYGQALGSNYQSQGLALAKQFRR